MTTTTLTQDNIWEAMDDNFLYVPINFVTGQKFVYRFDHSGISTTADAISFLRALKLSINISNNQDEVDEHMTLNGQVAPNGVIERENWIMPNYPINKELFA